MARAKRKLPAKPAAFISPQHRSHFCRRHPIPEHKAPPPTIHTPQKPTARSNSTDRRPNTKNPLPLRTPPAVFISSHHRGHFCCRHPIPEHKAPAADDNTHPTKTSRPDQTAPTDARTQKTRCRRQYTPHKNLTARSNGTDRYPNTKKTRCRSEHRRPVLFFRTTAVPPAAVIRYPNTKPPPPTIHTPQKPHGSVKRHRPTPEHKKPAAAPNTAGRFRFL